MYIWIPDILCHSIKEQVTSGPNYNRGTASFCIRENVKAINQLLDYCATYPDDVIVYHSSDMIMTAHSDTGFNKEKKSRSRAGDHIFISKNEPIPRWNGPILTIAKIMVYVLSLAAELGTSALFLTAK